MSLPAHPDTVRRSPRAWLVLLLAAIALTSAAPAHAAPGFFGIQSWTDASERDLAGMRAAGAGVLRVNMNWGSVEPERGVRDWDRYDRLFERTSRAGMDVLPVLVGSPAFAAARPQFPPYRRLWPRYAAFIRAAVARYGRGGTFWEANPALDPRPATAWQAWNEPNLGGWWRERPDFREYVELLKVMATAVRDRDARARIVLAGMPTNATDTPLPEYLRRIYRVPGAKRLFDVVAAHPYGRSPADAVAIVRDTRAVMNAAGDSRTPIWVTEFGWSSAPRAVPTALSTTERGQADRLRRTLAALVEARRSLRIGRAFWFSWADREPVRGEANWFALHTGITRVDGSRKPSWWAFRRLARR